MAHSQPRNHFFKQVADSLEQLVSQSVDLDSNRVAGLKTMVELLNRFGEILLLPEADAMGSYRSLFGSLREALSERETEDALAMQVAQTVNEFDIRHQFVFDLLRGFRREVEQTVAFRKAGGETHGYLTVSSLLFCCGKIFGQDFYETEHWESLFYRLGKSIRLCIHLENFPGDLENRDVYFSVDDCNARGLDLLNQSIPIDHPGWSDLVNSTCREIQTDLKSVCDRKQEFSEPIRKWLMPQVAEHWAWVKTVRRKPVDILRDSPKLSRWQKFCLKLHSMTGYRFFSIPQSA